MEHVVSWLPGGRAFRIHRPQDFAKIILPRYFTANQIRSFHRQLNIYCFKRIDKRLSDAFGAYWHKCFVRGNPSLCSRMVRIVVKKEEGTKKLAGEKGGVVGEAHPPARTTRVSPGKQQLSRQLQQQQSIARAQHGKPFVRSGMTPSTTSTSSGNSTGNDKKDEAGATTTTADDDDRKYVNHLPENETPLACSSLPFATTLFPTMEQCKNVATEELVLGSNGGFEISWRWRSSTTVQHDHDVVEGVGERAAVAAPPSCNRLLQTENAPFGCTDQQHYHEEDKDAIMILKTGAAPFPTTKEASSRLQEDFTTLLRGYNQLLVSQEDFLQDLKRRTRV
jgi:hypothetical protein